MSNNARDTKFWADMIFYATDGRPAFVVLENYVGGHYYLHLPTGKCIQKNNRGQFYR